MLGIVGVDRPFETAPLARGLLRANGEESMRPTPHRGNGEGSKNGVDGGAVFFINSPANIREGMWANGPLDEPVWLCKITNLSLALHALRVGIMDNSDPFPPDQADDHQLKSGITATRCYEPLKKTRTV